MKCATERHEFALAIEQHFHVAIEYFDAVEKLAEHDDHTGVTRVVRHHAFGCLQRLRRQTIHVRVRR